MNSVIITGAGGNLGRSVVDLLSKEYIVHATLSEHENENIFDQYAFRQNIHTYKVNLSEEKITREFIHSVIDTSDHIQAAVMLVGGWQQGILEESSMDDLNKMIQLNFFTAFTIIKPLIKYFKARGGGRFILIGARPAIKPADAGNQFAYALSKSMVFKMAEIINATEKNIQAHIIIPSILDTPQNRKAMPDADASAWVKTEDIAACIRYLLSPSGRNLKEGVLKMYNNA